MATREMKIRRVRLLAVLPLLLALLLAACGGDGAPAPPPSGELVFTSDRDGNSEIYIMNADGTEERNLTNAPELDDGAWWSPDGEMIAFSSIRNDSPDIYTMDAEGSDIRRRTNDPAVDGGVRWSPDGTRIAFYSFQQDSAGLLWVANADFTDQRPVLAAIHPSGPEVDCGGGFPGGWFPDGERILFRGARGDSRSLQICSIRPDGSDLRVILSDSGVFNYDPTISPDGTRMAFVSDRDQGNMEIYVADIDGGNLRRVTNDPGVDLNPTWSPDGEWLAFASDRAGNSDIYIVRVDGSGVKQLTDNEAEDTMPSWRPVPTP